jgi:hypothetical protein
VSRPRFGKEAGASGFLEFQQSAVIFPVAVTVKT